MASEVVAMGRVAERWILAVFRIGVFCDCDKGRVRLASGDLCYQSTCDGLHSRSYRAEIIVANSKTGTIVFNEQSLPKC